MFPCTLQQCCDLTGAVLHGNPNLTGMITDVVIDSRQAAPGTLFVALPGTKTHGATFAAEAVRRGAAVLTDAEGVSLTGSPSLQVRDSVQALQQLAAEHRRRSEAVTVGITGSVGKTTTRRLIAAALSGAYSGVQSPHNYNNELGVPLSLLQIRPDSEFAVIEMGARRAGDITKLCQLACPEVGVVTRVAPSHLAEFSSLEQIAQTKSELIASLDQTGLAVLNADDALVLAMRPTASGEVVTVGQTAEADYRYQIQGISNTQLQIQFNGSQYRAQLSGAHLATALATAVVVAQELGVATTEIQSGLETFRPLAGRVAPLQIGGVQVIDDTYNASPASVQAATEMLNNWQTQGRRIFVLGDMLDLGNTSVNRHREVGRQLAQSRIDHILFYGQFAADVARGFLSAGGSANRISVFDSQDLLKSMLDCVLSDGDAVLVKGSRGMAMERVIEDLLQKSVSEPAIAA